MASVIGPSVAAENVDAVAVEPEPDPDVAPKPPQPASDRAAKPSEADKNARRVIWDVMLGEWAIGGLL